jgi:hypothetical protein
VAVVVGAIVIVVCVWEAVVGVVDSTSADCPHAASTRVKARAIGRIDVTVEHLRTQSLLSRARASLAP